MKIYILISILLFHFMVGFGQTFEVEYETPSFRPFMVENKDGSFFLVGRKQAANNTFYEEFSILDKYGKKIKSKKIVGNDSITYAMDKIIATDTGYIGFGQKIYLKQNQKIDLWVTVIDKQLNIIKELTSPLTNGTTVANIDAVAHKYNYYITGYSEAEKAFSFLGKVNIHKEQIVIRDSIKYLTGSEHSTNIMSFKDNLMVSVESNVIEISDSLTILKKATIPFTSNNNIPNVTQGELLKLSDTEYLIASIWQMPNTSCTDTSCSVSSGKMPFNIV